MRAPAKVSPLGEGRRLDVLGSHLLLKVTLEETGGLYELYEQRGVPGHGVPLHVHTHEDETFYVVEGRVRFQVADRTLEAGLGTTVFAPRDVPHSYTMIGEHEAALLFLVSPTALEPMFVALSALPPGPPDYHKVAEICGLYGIRFGPPA